MIIMKNLTKIILSAFVAMTLTTTLNAAAPEKPAAATYQKQENFQIVEDTTFKDGTRHIKAVPSKNVCSALIDFDIVDGKIFNLVYQRGCDGNLKAIGKLLEGMTVKEAIERLDGVDCHGRGTSCTDQLAQILKTL